MELQEIGCSKLVLNHTHIHNSKVALDKVQYAVVGYVKVYHTGNCPPAPFGIDYSSADSALLAAHHYSKLVSAQTE